MKYIQQNKYTFSAYFSFEIKESYATQLYFSLKFRISSDAVSISLTFPTSILLSYMVQNAIHKVTEFIFMRFYQQVT